jgi:hypothetical protein
MDEYGTCTLSDAPMLAKKLNAGDAIIFGYSNDDINGYVISISPRLTPVGTMPFGGDPTGKYGIGVLMRGFFHFDLNKIEPFYESYIGEKLGLRRPDARPVAQMLNAIRSELITITSKEE